MYVITRTCPIECLAPLLSRKTFSALAAGMQCSPATVGQVIELYEQGQLQDIENISTGRAGEIRRSLIEAKLIELNSRPIIRRRTVRDASVPDGHHASCPMYLRASKNGTGFAECRPRSDLPKVDTKTSEAPIICG